MPCTVHAIERPKQSAARQTESKLFGLRSETSTLVALRATMWVTITNLSTNNALHLALRTTWTHRTTGSSGLTARLPEAAAAAAAAPVAAQWQQQQQWNNRSDNSKAIATDSATRKPWPPWKAWNF